MNRLGREGELCSHPRQQIFVTKQRRKAKSPVKFCLALALATLPWRCAGAEPFRALFLRSGVCLFPPSPHVRWRWVGSVPLLVPGAGRQWWPWQGAGILPRGCFLWRGSRSAAALRAGSIPIARDSLLFCLLAGTSSPKHQLVFSYGTSVQVRTLPWEMLQ